jgi:hypothetical protein
MGTSTGIGVGATTNVPATVVNTLLQAALNKANTSDTAARGYLDRAASQANNAPRMTAAELDFTLADDLEPDVFIPKVAEGASVELFNSLWQQVNDSILDKMEWFVARFFPNECPYLQRAQLWICKTLAEGGTGMNPQVEDMIWQRDRARVLKDAARQEEEVINSYAARGFPLPPGAMAAALDRVRADSYDKIAQASRDVAIKQAEIEIENVRFAVEQAIKLYSSLMGALGDFIKAMVSSAQMGSQLIPSVTDSQSKLISAASEYFRARIACQELLLRHLTTESGFKQEMNKENQDANLQAMKMRIDAALEAAKSLAMQASAALNAIHASAGISGNDNTSHNYSYSMEGN